MWQGALDKVRTDPISAEARQLQIVKLLLFVTEESAVVHLSKTFGSFAGAVATHLKPESKQGDEKQDAGALPADHQSDLWQAKLRVKHPSGRRCKLIRHL